MQPAVFVQVSNYYFRGVTNLALLAIHVQLPFQMFGERRRFGQKLFEGRRVFLVLKLLRLVSGIEVVLKLAAEIDFLKSIARSVRISGNFISTLPRSGFDFAARRLSFDLPR